MIRFSYFANWFETSLLELGNAYNGVNNLDIENGGDGFSYSQMLETLRSTAAKDEVVAGQTFPKSDMKTFISNILNAMYSYSNKMDTKKEGENVPVPYAHFEINEKYYGKQKLLMEVAKTICETKFKAVVID